MRELKLEILDLLDDIFYELAAQEMDVSFKDVVDYLYRNRKDLQTDDSITKLMLKQYLAELKSTADESKA